MIRKKSALTAAAVLVAVLVMGIIVGRVTSASFIHNEDLETYLKNPDLKVVYCDMGYDEDTNRGYLDNEKITKRESLETPEAVIVKVRQNAKYERKISYECVISQVEVEQVYQGELAEGEMLTILEPVDCESPKEMMCTDGYSLMQKGQEYILFLKKLKNSHYGSDPYVYAPSSTQFGKYPVESGDVTLFTPEQIDDGEFLNYSEIGQEEIFLDEKEVYERYLKLREEVLAVYGK